jgi:hypothetical protein
MKSLFPLAALLLLTAAGDPPTAPPADPYAGRPEARIPFASSIGIRNFDVRKENKRDVLYIEGPNRTWYRATLFGLCSDIRFATALGFETRATNTLDRFSRVVVPRPGSSADICSLSSLVELTKDEAIALKLRAKPKQPKATATPTNSPAKP